LSPESYGYKAKNTSQLQQAIKAGYSKSYASQGTKALLQNPTITQSLPQLLDDAGVTDKAIAEAIRSLMCAKKLHYLDNYRG
jgi:hypothetical protein